LAPPTAEAARLTQGLGAISSSCPHEAVDRVARAIVQHKTRVIDIDLRNYFDNVRHDRLLAKVARRVDDADVMRLLKVMLKANGQRGVHVERTLARLSAFRSDLIDPTMVVLDIASRCEEGSNNTPFSNRKRDGGAERCAILAAARSYFIRSQTSVLTLSLPLIGLTIVGVLIVSRLSLTSMKRCWSVPFHAWFHETSTLWVILAPSML
jgi:hypothetical protein